MQSGSLKKALRFLAVGVLAVLVAPTAQAQFYSDGPPVIAPPNYGEHQKTIVSEELQPISPPVVVPAQADYEPLPLVKAPLPTVSPGSKSQTKKSAPTEAQVLPIEGHPAIDSVHRAVELSVPKSRALTTVARALDIALESLATPEGEARSVSTARDSSVDREFARLLAHPKEFEDICEVSRALAARYPGVDDTSETFVAESLIQLAVQMDMRGGSCLSNLLVTFPNNLEVDAAIANTHALCTNTWHLGANCDRITRTH